MLFFLAILGAVLSWEASRVAIQYGLPVNLAELAPLLAVFSACLWAIWFLEAGPTRSQLWLAVAPFAWLGGGVLGSHLYVPAPGDEQLLWWLPSCLQSPAVATALASYLSCMVSGPLRALGRSLAPPTSTVKGGAAAAPRTRPVTEALALPKSSVSGGDTPAKDIPTLH